MVTPGSQHSHRATQLNDCALTAFSNPFEINLIFIYLQSSSLHGTCKTVNRSLSHGKLPKRPLSGEPTGGILPHLSQRVFFLPDPSSMFSQATFYCSHCAARADYWPCLKNVPFLVHLGNHGQEPGVLLGSNLVTSNLAPFVGKFKEWHPQDLMEATISTALSRHHV